MTIKSRLHWVLLVFSLLSAAGWFFARDDEKICQLFNQAEWDEMKEARDELWSLRKDKPQPGYLYSEPVAWGSLGDYTHGRLVDAWLTDRRMVMLDLNGIKLAEVLKWPKGKKFYLCYSIESGAVLREADGTREIFVRGIEKGHPAEKYLEAIDDDCTRLYTNYTEEATMVWKREVDRAVLDILSMRALPGRMRADCVALAKLRRDYCDAQARLGADSILGVGRGTGTGPRAGDYVARVYHDAYLQLAVLYEEYRNLETDPPIDSGR